MFEASVDQPFNPNSNQPDQADVQVLPAAETNEFINKGLGRVDWGTWGNHDETQENNCGLSAVVFNDVNYDGQMGPGESPVAGADTTVYSLGGEKLAQSTTGADGKADFSNLPCVVDGWLTANTTVGTPLYASKPVAITNTSSVEVAATPRQRVTVLGRFGTDTNGNGTLDPDEPSIRGVVISFQDSGQRALLEWEFTTDKGLYGLTTDQVDPRGYHIRAAGPLSVQAKLPSLISTVTTVRIPPIAPGGVFVAAIPFPPETTVAGFLPVVMW